MSSIKVTWEEKIYEKREAIVECENMGDAIKAVMDGKVTGTVCATPRRAGLVRTSVAANKLKPDDSQGEDTDLPVVLTKKQRQMIIAIARSQYTASNGDVPTTYMDTTVWANTIINTPQDNGVFTSLMRRGLVEHYDYRLKPGDDTSDNLCRLSVQGFKEYKKMPYNDDNPPPRNSLKT